RSLLILIGSTPERQLPTILSRCQVVRFAPLPSTTVAELLREQGMDDGMVQRLARLSGGSPGQALLLADPPLWEFRRTRRTGLTAGRMDSAALSTAWTQFVEEAGKEAAAQRGRAALVLRLLIEFFNDALTLRQGGAPRLDEADDRRALEEVAKRA